MKRGFSAYMTKTENLQCRICGAKQKGALKQINVSRENLILKIDLNLLKLFRFNKIIMRYIKKQESMVISQGKN